MTKTNQPDPVLEQYLRATDGKKLAEVHVYGHIAELQELASDPALRGTRIIPHRPLEEGGSIRTHIPCR